MQFSNIGIIGAGTMGIGMCIDLAFHGMSSVLVDISDDVLESAKKEITKIVRFAPLVDKNLPKMDVDKVLSKIKLTTNIEDVAECEFVVENVTENWGIKETVYKQLSKI